MQPSRRTLLLILLTYSIFPTTLHQSNEIDTVEFEHLSVCCGRCDPTTYEDEKKKCRIITEHLHLACLSDLKCESHALLRTIKVTPVPNEPDLVLITWLSRYREDVSLKTRFLNFKDCKKIGEVNKVEYQDENEVLDILDRMTMSEYDVSFDDYDCFKDFCEITLTKTISPPPPKKKPNYGKALTFPENPTVCVAMCDKSTKECNVLPIDKMLTWPQACKVSLKSNLANVRPHSVRVDRISTTGYLRLHWLYTPKESRYQEFDMIKAKSASELKKKHFTSEDEALIHMDKKYSVKHTTVYDDKFSCLGVACHITMAWNS